jgi:hypothetical protein
MKKLHLLSALIIIFFQSYAQWPARYNSGANRNDQARLIAVDENNNVYVSGVSDGQKGGNWDIVTIKYSSAGVQQWLARYNGPGNGTDYPYAMTIKNGYVYVTGRSIGAGTNDDFITLKYAMDGNGTPENIMRTNNVYFDEAHDVKVDNSGNIFVTGSTGRNAGNTERVMTTIKYNSDGLFKWRDDISWQGNSSSGNSIVLDELGNIYVAGSISSGTLIKYKDLGETFSKEWQTDFTNNAARKMLADRDGNLIISGWGDNLETIKINPTGTIIGQYSVPNAGAAWDMKLDDAGNIYLAGIKSGQPDGSNDYVTAKINADGSNPWIRYYSTSVGGRDHARAIALDAQGNVFVTGFSELISGRNVNRNYATVKYNNSGLELWAKLYDGPDKNVDDGFGIATDASGNAYVTGQSAIKTQYDCLTIMYPANTSQLISKASADREITEAQPYLTNYPNPFTHSTIIEYQLPQNGKVNLSVYDLQGREMAQLVNTVQAAGSYKVRFATNKWPAGTYICRLQCGELIETRKMVVVQ